MSDTPRPITPAYFGMSMPSKSGKQSSIIDAFKRCVVLRDQDDIEQIAALEKDNAKLRRELCDLRVARGRMVDDMGALQHRSDACISDLQNQVEDLRAENGACLSKLVALEQDLQDAKSLYGDLAAENDTLKRVGDVDQQAEIDALKAKVDVLSRQMIAHIEAVRDGILDGRKA